MKRLRSISLVLILMLSLVMITGCPDKKQGAKKPESSSQEQKPKAPKALSEMLKNIDDINNGLTMKVIAKRDPSKLQTAQTQSSGGSQGGGSQGGSQGGSKGGSQGSSGGGSQGGSQGGQTSTWTKEDMAVVNIHKNWNNIAPEAIKAGLSTSTLDSLEKALNELTSKVSERNLEDSRMAAINMYKPLAEISGVFASPTPPEFYLVKHEAMTAAALGERKDWAKASKHLPLIKKHWDLLRMQAKGVDEKIMSRTEFSIVDLEQSIKNEQVDLVIIKSEILKNNLSKLEKELAKSKKS